VGDLELNLGYRRESPCCPEHYKEETKKKKQKKEKKETTRNLEREDHKTLAFVQT